MKLTARKFIFLPIYLIRGIHLLFFVIWKFKVPEAVYFYGGEIMIGKRYYKVNSFKKAIFIPFSTYLDGSLRMGNYDEFPVFYPEKGIKFFI